MNAKIKFIIAFDAGAKGTRYADSDISDYGTFDPLSAIMFDSETEAQKWMEDNGYNGWVVPTSDIDPTQIFEVNGQTFKFDEPYEPCYGQYWNRGMNMKHTSVEPDGFDPDSIGEEWQYLETMEDFASFVQNIPNKGGYSPSSWAHNVKYFINYAAKKIEG